MDNSLSGNQYTYVLNNPLKYTDPSGHFFSSILNKVKDTVNKVKESVSSKNNVCTTSISKSVVASQINNKYKHNIPIKAANQYTFTENIKSISTGLGSFGVKTAGFFIGIGSGFTYSVGSLITNGNFTGFLEGYNMIDSGFTKPLSQTLYDLAPNKNLHNSSEFAANIGFLAYSTKQLLNSFNDIKLITESYIYNKTVMLSNGTLAFEPVMTLTYPVAITGIDGILMCNLGYMSSAVSTNLNYFSNSTKSSVPSSSSQSGKNIADTAFDSIDANHVLKSKHNWSKVVDNPNDFNQVKQIMQKVINEGVETSYNSAFKKVLNIDGHTVEVTYQKVDGVIKYISNGWVK